MMVFCRRAAALAAFVAATCATMVQAEDVPVRSGAHDGFVRLVVHLPRRVEWQLTGAGSERRLSFGSGDLRFDTSDVFNRITRDRIAAVTQPGAAVSSDAAALDIALACACEVTAYWAGSSMLVVDVSGDATALVPDKPDAVTAGATPPGATLGVTSTNSFDTMLALPDTAVPPGASAVVSRGLQQHLEAVPSPMASNTAPPVMSTDPFHAALAEELGRAASQGLLAAQTERPKPTSPDDPSREAASDATEMHEQDTAKQADMAAGAASAIAHSTFGTSFDETVLANGGTDHGDSHARACPDSTALDVMEWASDADFSTQIGTLRHRLTSEFDRVDPAALKELARAYVHFGFGAEALQVLDLAGDAVDRADKTGLIREMAMILETGALDRPSALHGHMGCDGPAALWSVLAHPEISPETEVNEAAVLRTLSAMPQHLRDYLGPIAARRFLAAGRTQSAERLFHILDRDDIEGSSAEQLAKAVATMSDDMPGAADDRLAVVSAGNSKLAAEALLHRIETRLATGRGVPEDMADLASAYALEMRDTALGQSLLRAGLEAMAAAGNFDGAFAEWGRLRADLSADDNRRVVNTVYGLLARDGADMVFLTRAFGASDITVKQLDTETGNNVAMRLLELGFARAALRYVASNEEGEGMRDRRIIRAGAALAMDQPRRAENALLGLRGEDVALLQARASAMTGQSEASQRMFSGAGDEDAVAREAALRQDWAELAALLDGDEAQLAASLSASEPEPDPETPLANSRALLDGSRSARGTVEALLAGLPDPSAQ